MRCELCSYYTTEAGFEAETCYNRYENQQHIGVCLEFCDMK